MRVQEKIEDLEPLILSWQNRDDVPEIPEMVKLKGYDHYYRIRVGNYRLGVSMEEDSFCFVRFLHRKDIYKYFP